MTQLYKIRPLRWSGKIEFEDDGFPGGRIECDRAPFAITGDISGYDCETEEFTRPEPSEKYCLEWSLAEYYDEWMEHYPTLKSAKQRAWEYWLEYMEPKLVKLRDEMPGQAKGRNESS